MSKPEIRNEQSNSTLKLAKTAKQTSMFSKKREWKPPVYTSKISVNLDYLASFHSSP